MAEPVINTSPLVGDEVKYSTCYMCACRCGIKVHLKDGKVRYIEGNRNHPVNKGVLCGKGSSGIMKQYSPAKLSKPLKRVGPRGSNEFEEIEWDEALQIVCDRLGHIRATDPNKLAFFTGRDQSQALTGWWASQFGTRNYAAHGGFCSVNMAAGGLYTIGGAFWEFGEPDWERTKMFMMFGMAEDHDSNPIKIGLGKMKGNGAKFVSVNPIRTGYSGIADEWVGIRPGTDGLFIMSMIRELLLADKVDFDYLVRYTNAPWLVIQDPGAADHGLIARNDAGEPLCFDGEKQALVNALEAEVKPRMVGEVTLPDGRKAVPAFQLMAERYMSNDYAPERVEGITGVPAETIRRLAAELAHTAFEEQIELDVAWTDWAGRKHDKMIGRPVSFHAMRGISAHSNGFHTCRALHFLQVLLGSVDCPGGFRYKPPFPKPVPPPIKPAGKDTQPNTPLAGPPLGFTQGPEDLLVDDEGNPLRIDKAYSWEAPMSAHGMMHMVITNAWKGDPYPIDTLFMFMANMSWNSTMNTSKVIEMLTDVDEATGEYKIPNIIYSDAFFSEMVPYADIILPDTTYLERYDCISLLDRPISEADGPADSIRHPLVETGRNVRSFQDVLIDIGARIGLPGLITPEGKPKYPGGLKDYIVNHERAPGVGMLAGFRGADGTKKGKGEPNPKQLERYIENGGFWHDVLPEDCRFYKHANAGYLQYAVDMGFAGSTTPIIMQLYSEPLQKFRLAAEGHGPVQPPEMHRERILKYFDPLPIWYMPFEEQMIDKKAYPLHALTQRPMIMYHSWDSQNAWQRQIISYNRLYVSSILAEEKGLKDDDWVYVSSHNGKIKCQIRIQQGLNSRTVWTWNAIGKRRGAWNLDKDAAEGTKGFLLNHLISELLPEKQNGYHYSNSDPVTGQGAWFDLRVDIEKVDEAHVDGLSEPQFEPLEPVPGLPERPERSSYGKDFRAKEDA